MFKHIQFKAGSAPGQSPLTLPLEPSVTVFVGPNNSGKSLALAELRSVFAGSSGQVVEKVILTSPSADEVEALITKFRSKSGSDIVEVISSDGRHAAQTISKLRNYLVPPNFDRDLYWETFGAPRLSYLSGANRTIILNPQSRGNLLYPTNEFGRLLKDASSRKKFDNIVKDAIGFHIGIDALFEGDLISLFFGRQPPLGEGSVSDEFAAWLKDAKKPDNFSDGIRAFLGILLKLKVGDPQTFLIDEPEAFLHPTLAHKLGVELARGAVSEGKYVFAATHSAHFLMGAVQSGANVNVVRLSYRDGIATARHLPSSTLRTFMNDPMLRSVGVLDGLFCEHVVVTEADADRAFYSEINHRLVQAGDPRGIPNVLFLNADNKQTVPTILKALRQVGIPAASIIDIDLIVDGWNEVSKHLIGYPDQSRSGLAQQTKEVLKTLEAASPGDKVQDKRDYFKSPIGRGIEVLTNNDQRDAADMVFGTFDEYGCFAVRCGELECWLPNLRDLPRRKKGPVSFRAKVFEAMGNDPNKPNYVGPARGDVWDFIGKVKAWLTNPYRKGMPE